MKSELNKDFTVELDIWQKIKTLIENEEPARYLVVMHNDDFTPMEFAVCVLERFFYMDRRQATDRMMEAHISGRTLCGLFTKDVAETKIAQVIDYARSHEHPLICSMEAA